MHILIDEKKVGEGKGVGGLGGVDREGWIRMVGEMGEGKRVEKGRERGIGGGGATDGWGRQGNKGIVRGAGKEWWNREGERLRTKEGRGMNHAVVYR